MPKSTTQKKINHKKTTPDVSNPSTAVIAISASIPSCSHRAPTDNNTSSNNNNTSGKVKSSKSSKSPKSSMSCPHELDSVGTSLCIATQGFLQESKLEMPKIPKKKRTVGGGDGRANLNLEHEDTVEGGVGLSRKVATIRG